MAINYTMCMKNNLICELHREKCNTGDSLAVHKEREHQ